MPIDLDTFLTTVYCIIADIYQAYFAKQKPVRPGKRPELSDEEVLTLTILAQWQSQRSERAFGRYAAKNWRSYFPRLLSQSQFNRRARDLSGVLCALGPAIGLALTQALGVPAYEVLDGVPVPLMRRCRGDRHRLFADEANIGWGGSDRDYYYGVELFTAVNAHGVITGFVFAPASTAEYWLAEALLRWRTWPQAAAPRLQDLVAYLPKMHPLHGQPRTRRGPSGPFSPATGVGQATAAAYIADLGLVGAKWQHHWLLDYGASVLTQNAFDRQPNEKMLDRQWHSRRQVIEQVNQLLTTYLGLSFPKARTPWGLLARLAAKVAACNLWLSLNHFLARPLFSFLSPFD